jgi:hypothetical protein
VHKVIDPASVWGWSEVLLADIANSLRWLVWSKTKAAARGRSKPSMIEPPSVRTAYGKTARAAGSNHTIMPVDDYRAFLSKIRKEVING